jgi:hypothetical protein
MLGGVLTGLFLVVGYAPWWPIFWRQLRQVQGDYWIRPLGERMLAVVPVQLLSIARNDLPAWPRWLLVLAGLGTVLVFFPWRRRPAEWQLLLIAGSYALGIGAATWLLGRSVFVPRYLLPVLPLALVPLAYWLLRIRDRMIRWTLVAASLLLCGNSLLTIVWDYHLWSPAESAYAQAVAYLREQGAEGEPIVLSSREDFLLFYYAAQQAGLVAPIYFCDTPGETTDKHVVFAASLRSGEQLDSGAVWRWKRRWWLVSAWGSWPAPAGWRRLPYVGSVMQDGPVFKSLVILGYEPQGRS